MCKICALKAHKTLLRETKQDLNGELHCIHGSKNFKNVNMLILPKLIYRVNVNPIKTLTDIL